MQRAPDPAATLGLASWRWNNNAMSALLLVAFPLLLLLLVWGIAFAGGHVLAYEDTPGVRAGFVPVQQIGDLVINAKPVKPGVFARDIARVALPWVFALAAFWSVIGYLFHGAMIASATGARDVERREQPRLYNLLENLCISRGMAMPRLYMIETDALNAYAAGLSEGSFSVTVTRGLVDTLNDAELEAVLAHELTHIINRDVRLLVITIVFVGMISFLAEMSWRSMRFTAHAGSVSSRNSGGGKKGGGAAMILLIAAILLALGYAMALMLRFAVSRRREYLADAGAVQLTKNPDAMIAALRKISGNPKVPGAPPDVQQMFIENPPPAMKMFSLFATHPPIEDRIRVLVQLGGRDLPPAGPWGARGGSNSVISEAG
ncbi:MAG: M48 family metalloprotease [Alphaproteobacteria bacterium]|nr:M48 family metalloprotease [Alphaproteobacteria bacterium]